MRREYGKAGRPFPGEPAVPGGAAADRRAARALGSARDPAPDSVHDFPAPAFDRRTQKESS
ncbi:hypothetical protein VR46_17300 [Streptomyces sp. NRRL S-444]|nr:hypothetical protein VR46_17300 [Streptomyces sp. NRRL S-444]